MTVLIVTALASHSPSGVVTYYNTLADDLRKQGMNVSILDSLDTPAFWRKCMVLMNKVTRYVGPMSQAFYEEFAQFTCMYLSVRANRNLRPDLIHAQDAKTGTAAFLALGKKVPVVMTCHFNDDPATELAGRFPMKAWFKRRLLNWYKYLFSHIKSYVFVSDYAYNKSKHLLPDDAQKITIHNTVTIESEKASVNAVNSEQLIICNVGYVDERKNQKLLIQIGYELRQRGIANFSLWFIGDGPKRQEYEQLAQSLGMSEQVRFYGQQENPWRFVAQADLYIHTALNDNCPYAIIEAFAVQTPVLALPVGGIPEMMPEHAGLLEGTTLEALTDEVAAYFNVEERAQLRQAQAHYADQHFNHRQSLTQLMSFYHQTEQLA